MNRKQFRLLVAILSSKRIAFRWRREAGTYHLSFDTKWLNEVHRAAGA